MNNSLSATLDKSFPSEQSSLGTRRVSSAAKTEDGSRPKRAAAMNRPDYHALHHHIATPTARWLDLIHDPKKYGATISGGESLHHPAETDNFHRVPASSVRKQSLQDQSTIPFHGRNREPFVITPDGGGYSGLGGTLPSPSLTVKDVSRLVGPERMVDVIGMSVMKTR
jgi:F-box/leucine-rich repeat protein 10/11